jgi:diguanylate cyclase (GGDEF)-like protein/PAS domain S-box-containing protein
MPLRRLPLLGAALMAIPLVVLLHHDRFRDTDDLALFGVVATLIPTIVVYRLTDLVATARRLGRAASESARVAAESAARLEAVLDASPLPIAVLGETGDVQRWNGAAEAALGWQADEVIGKRWQMLPAPGEKRAEGICRRALAGERLDHVELGLRRHDGEARRIELSTAPVGPPDELEAVVAVFEDVTDERRHEDEIRYLAEHDSLTGLLNRRRFSERLADEVAASAATGADLLVAVADLDNFKLVNDSAGHHVGDEVLRDVANLFASRLRPQDVCARLSGDEFAFLMPGCRPDEAFAVAQRLLQAVRDYRLPTENGSIAVTTSIGLSPLRHGGEPVALEEEAMIAADTALYEAKARGRNRASMWSPALTETHQFAVRQGWSSRIREALSDDRFLIHLQPIVDLRSTEPAYHEALMRMTDEHGQLVSPGEFLPHASRSGLVEDIDRRAVEQAVALLHAEPTLRIFVNLDPRSFSSDELLDWIEKILKEAPGLAHRFGIEITERAPMRDYERAERRLTTLKSLGCLIAIDDFGTGFSSFEHLRRLPADLVKVGNGFIEGLGSDPVSDAILDGIIATAHAVSMQVVAEGIETLATASVLASHRIEYAQGYLYGRPRAHELQGLVGRVA